MTAPFFPYKAPMAVTLAGMMAASQVYNLGYRGNGWPVPFTGETPEDYNNRVFPGTSWHPKSSDPIAAAIDAVGNFTIDLGLDVVTPFAAVVGGGGAVQNAKAIADAGLATDEAHDLQSGDGSGKPVGPTIHYVPPIGPAFGGLSTAIAKANAPPTFHLVTAAPPSAAQAAWNQILALHSAAMQAAAKAPAKASAPAAAAAPTPWYSRKIAGNFTTGEAGIAAAAAGVLWKLLA